MVQKLKNSNTGKETILTFKVNRTLLWNSAFIKTEITFIPRQLLATFGFPNFYFDLLTNEIEGKHATQIWQAVISLRQ